MVTLRVEGSLVEGRTQTGGGAQAKGFDPSHQRTVWVNGLRGQTVPQVSQPKREFRTAAWTQLLGSVLEEEETLFELEVGADSDSEEGAWLELGTPMGTGTAAYLEG